MTFENLNLIPQLLQSLKAKGYTQPTPIQEKAIPSVLEGRDLFGMAQTGTGKTAAFALPILQNLHAKKSGKRGIKALILAPTRELAQQISDSFRDYGKGLHLKQTVIYGGVSQRPQTEMLRSGVDIVIATPGRLLDLIDQGYVRLNEVEFFVLDEVDRMLDMGFITDIKKIVTTLPAKKQTLFFSATFPNEIKKLADSLLNNPVSVRMTPTSSAAQTVKQFVYYIPKEQKRQLLITLFNSEVEHHSIIFTRTKRGADRLVKNLSASGLRSEAIHGDKSQGARQRALQQFKNRKISFLVATDVASRGLDINDITHVVNYDLPEEAEVYIHRIGRTGRAGATGIALSFCSNDERHIMKDINKLAGNKIEVLPMPELMAVPAVSQSSSAPEREFRREKKSYHGKSKKPDFWQRSKKKKWGNKKNGKKQFAGSSSSPAKQYQKSSDSFSY